MSPEFQVIVNEGTSDSDQITYFAREKPEIVVDQGEKFLRFVPRNGQVTRVGRINDVPMHRVVAIVSVEEIALDE